MSNMYDDSFDGDCGDCDCWERGYHAALTDSRNDGKLIAVLLFFVGVSIGVCAAGVWLW